MPNDPGYKILSGVAPTHEKIETAKAEISMENLVKLQQSTSPLGFERLGWGKNSNGLLHDELDVRAFFCCPKNYADETQLDGDEYLKDLLRGPYAHANIHMAAAVVWMKNPSQLQRLKAGRGLVFIYKAVEETLGPENGFFRIVEGSQRMSPEQIVNANARDIYLQPGEAIILDGDLAIEYPQAGGGVGLVKCISKYPSKA